MLFYIITFQHLASHESGAACVNCVPEIFKEKGRVVVAVSHTALGPGTISVWIFHVFCVFVGPMQLPPTVQKHAFKWQEGIELGMIVYFSMSDMPLSWLSQLPLDKFRIMPLDKRLLR